MKPEEVAEAEAPITADGLIAQRKKVEQDRLDMINKLIDEKERVRVQADISIDKIVAQLRSLDWKAPRKPREKKEKTTA